MYSLKKGCVCVQIVHPKTTTFLKFKTVCKYGVYVFDLNPKLFFPKELLDQIPFSHHFVAEFKSLTIEIMHIIFLCYSFLNFHLGNNKKFNKKGTQCETSIFHATYAKNYFSHSTTMQVQEDPSRLILTSGAEKVKVCKIQHALQHLQRDEATVLVCQPMLTLPFLDNLSCAHTGGT